MINHIKNNWKNGCAVKITFNNGSFFETEKTEGYLHIGEHLAFSGTKSIPRNDLEIIFGKIFGNIEASTSREELSFFCDFHQNDFEQAIKILHEMIYYWHCTEKRIIEEKSMLKEESNDYFSSYEYRRTSYVYPLLPIRQSQVLASQKFINSFGYKDINKIQKFWNRFLQETSLDITVMCADLTLKNKQLLEKLFPKAKKQNRFSQNFNIVASGKVDAKRVSGVYFKSNSYSIKSLLLNKMYKERWLRDEKSDFDYNFFMFDGLTVYYGYHDEKKISQQTIKRFFEKDFSRDDFNAAKKDFLKIFELLIDGMDSNLSLHWFDGFRFGRYAELKKKNMSPKEIYSAFDNIQYKEMLSFMDFVNKN
jgi:hypothetical protein